MFLKLEVFVDDRLKGRKLLKFAYILYTIWVVIFNFFNFLFIV